MPSSKPFTELSDRTLWFDGDSSFKSSDILRLLQTYDVKYVDEVSSPIQEYNKHASSSQELRVKTGITPLSFDWNLPEEYKTLDVVDYLAVKQAEYTKNMPVKEQEARDIRLSQELLKYQERGLFDVLRAVIFVINTLTANDVVWGIGRGSSVSSYVLFLIGAHDVDSFSYELDIDDFLHS